MAKEKLAELETLAREHQARGMAGVMVSPETLLSLVVRARELEEAKVRAWDEGYSSGFSHHSKNNPYRQPKGPTK